MPHLKTTWCYHQDFMPASTTECFFLRAGILCFLRLWRKKSRLLIGWSDYLQFFFLIDFKHWCEAVNGRPLDAFSGNTTVSPRLSLSLSARASCCLPVWREEEDSVRTQCNWRQHKRRTRAPGTSTVDWECHHAAIFFFNILNVSVQDAAPV